MENKNNEIKETLNNVEITGVLVKNGLEVRNSGQEDENISGALVLRTEDGSEHDIRYYATRFKKKDGKFTSEESKLYPSYITMLENYKSLDMLQAGIELSDVKLGEDVDVIKTGSATFKDNDFMGKDGNIVSTNQLKATFANRVKPETIESTVRTAKFEVSGIITKMELETRKDGSQTGNGIVRLDMIGYQGTIIPIKLTVPQAIMEGFGQAGFYETGSAKFTGHIINTSKEEEVREKQSFGEDNVYTRTITVKRYEICGGSPLGTLESLGLTQEQYEMGKSKRRLKLEEVKNNDGATNSQPTQQNAFTQAPEQQANANPFSNPFAK